ncbi:AbiU2 domain-containing protein [Pontibacter sp. CAU 1760]
METINFEKKLNEISQILRDLEKLKKDIIFISDQESEYFVNAVENSDFLYRVYRNSIKLFVIDVCKLLHPNEHFSLAKTLAFAITERRRICWHRETSIEQLETLKEKVNNLNKEQLESFKTLRDKYYAHNDKAKHEHESKVTLSNCWKTLIILQDIYNELSLRFSNCQIAFESCGRTPNEIIAVSRFREIATFISNERRKSPNIGKLENIRDIILGKRPIGNNI